MSAAPVPAPKPQPRKVTSSNAGAVPPWKRGKAKQPQSDINDNDDDDVVIAAAPVPPQKEPEVMVAAPPIPANSTAGFKNNELPNTFKGDRGGAAEDEDLLAELRAISAGASSNRFADNDETSALPSQPSPAPAPRPKPAAPRRTPNQKGGDVPPWKRGNGGQAQGIMGSPVPQSPGIAVMERPIPSNPTVGFKNTNLPNTFKGDRGGAAEDEDLLAELRAISAGKGSSRFADEEDGDDGGAGPSPPPAPAPVTPAKAPPAMNHSMAASATPPPSAYPQPSPFPPSSSPGEQIVVTAEELPTAINDTNWKIRKESYEVIRKMILESSGGSEPSGIIDANTILPGLDDLIPKFVSDKNAGALDSALQLGVIYADYCRGGGSPERAGAITKAIVTGNGFTSPRPTAPKMSASLLLKLMEVSHDDTASLNCIIDILLASGLTSKKPKVVLQSSSLILEAATSFGAACLPLASISSSIPKMLSHSNKKVRDGGMQILAEFCRALGSRTPMEGVISKMKPAQVKDLDSLLQKTPEAATPSTVLRSRKGSSDGGPGDALEALQKGAEALAAEQFAKRPAVNIMSELPKTEYATKLALSKWSEKVGALDLVIECAGQKPYKLVQPSSSANYQPLISEMKGLLSHTHFAVCGKAMAVLSLLAEGVGEKLYPNLRPLLCKLLQLSKDKKLTKAVSSCLDSFFGNILGFDHILDNDDAVPTGADERQEKNALARTSALDFLGRCIQRRESAGSRGTLSQRTALKCAKFCAVKLDDSDANVRKAALNCLKLLQAVDDADCADAINGVIEELKNTNARAYKSLGGGAKKATPAAGKSAPKSGPLAKAAPTSRAAQKSDDSSVSERSMPRNVPVKRQQSDTSSSSQRGTRPPPATSQPKPKALPVTSAPAPATAAPRVPVTQGSGNEDAPSIDEAVGHCASLGIPLWDAEDEEGGVLAGLQSTKWLFRQNAIKGISSFVEGRDVVSSPDAIEKDTVCFLVFVKENTRGFKETNVNVTKAIMELFITLCDYHEKACQLFPEWALCDGVRLATEKIADKKLSPICKTLLSACCVVQAPKVVLSAASTCIQKVRSPVAHEELLKWLKDFCSQFGAASIGSGINETVCWLLEESKMSNPKVKKAALAAFGALHVQLGPGFQAVSTNACKDPSLRSQLEGAFNDHPHDPSSSSSDWPKVSLAVQMNASGGPGGSGGGGAGGLVLEVPKTDLFAELSGDCIERMGAKEGKTAWKTRKAAMEEVEVALKRCSGQLDTSKLKMLVELLRALRERLSDSQSNLKPLAARIIGKFLSVVDPQSQAKLGKVAFGPLIGAALNDSKKIMHDAAMDALRQCTSMPPLDGEGPNELSLEPFLFALVGELGDSEYKASGIADVLELTQGFADKLPDLESISAARGETLGFKVSSTLVGCLTSSKADTRAAAESLLKVLVENDVVTIETVKKSAGSLKPAKQRSVGPIIAKLAGGGGTSQNSSQASTIGLSTNQGADMSRPKTGMRIPVPQKSRASMSSRTASAGTISSKRSTASSDDRRSAHDNSIADNNESGAHPLISKSSSAGVQKTRSLLRNLTWPEYPEEPAGSNVWNGLKRAWTPLLSNATVKVLFPDGGVRKQDDAKGGCELLSRAVAMERSGDGYAVVEQIDCILKWFTFILCCKESPAGLQALLSMLKDLLECLRESKYELSDAEIQQTVPFLFDRASMAKGRFKEAYTEILELVKAEDLLPTKKMGPLVCVALIESSSYAKARVLACIECTACIEKIGLSGIGKKGVLAAAKSLSEEKLPENRNALLDLFVLLLSRMNGDMARLARICGPNLSDKARGMVQERLDKGGSDVPPAPSRTGIPAPTSSHETQLKRPSRLPNPGKGPPSSATAARKSGTKPVTEKLSSDKSTASTGSETDGHSAVFRDELPSLDLRFGSSIPGAPKPPRTSGIGAINMTHSEASDLASAQLTPQNRLLHGRQITSHTSAATSAVAPGSLGKFSRMSFDRQDDGSATGSASGAPSSPISMDSREQTGRWSKMPTISGISAPLIPSTIAASRQIASPSAASVSSMRSTTSALREPTTASNVGGTSTTSTAGAGAAASLRARLMKLRERNKAGESGNTTNDAKTTQDSSVSPATAPKPAAEPLASADDSKADLGNSITDITATARTTVPAATIVVNDASASVHSMVSGLTEMGDMHGSVSEVPSISAKSEEPTTNSNEYHEPSDEPDGVDDVALELDKILESTDEADVTPPPANQYLPSAMDTMRALVEKATPLLEDDDTLVACTETLKKIHAAVSKQTNVAIDLNEDELLALRDEICDAANDVTGCLTQIIDYGFNCHEESLNAGMSVSLLSVCLASLMALFRDESLAKQVQQENLILLIKEAGSALLDHRLATSGKTSLDEATSSQMVRAINKLAVQAATGSARHTSLQSLLALQLQLALESSGDNGGVFSSRLSRVINKLFARVIKAEEGTTSPFSSTSMDTESLLCSLEDTLVGCEKAIDTGCLQEGVNTCKNLAKTLMTAMLKARGGPSTLLQEIDGLGIDTQVSCLSELVSSCASEMGYVSAIPPRASHVASRDVASLVSAVGSAAQGPERDSAIRALRDFTAKNGDDALNEHLDEVSAAFRAFILQQLSEATTTTSSDGNGAGSMSERIKSLRSKLHATEAAVQSAVDTITPEDDIKATQPATFATISQSASTTSSDGHSSAGSVRAFRERLAAAQIRTTGSSDSGGGGGDGDGDGVDGVPSVTSSSSAPPGGRAAALRARLLAVKKQSSNPNL